MLRTALAGWLDERPGWPGAQITLALFLIQRGQRLSAKGAHDVITGLAAAAGRFDEHGQPRDADAVNAAAGALLDQLAWWARALREARTVSPYGT
jgi:hypothetical protein